MARKCQTGGRISSDDRLIVAGLWLENICLGWPLFGHVVAFVWSRGIGRPTLTVNGVVGAEPEINSLPTASGGNDVITIVLECQRTRSPKLLEDPERRMSDVVVVK